MNIKISKKVLHEALKSVSPLCGRSKVLPILSCVKFVTKGSRIRLQSSDGQSTIRKYIVATSISEDGMFCVDCASLLKMVSSLPEQELSIEISSTTITVSHFQGEFSLPSDDVDSFPEITRLEEDADEAYIDAEAFVSAMEKSVPFMSTDELRPVLCGVYCEINGNIFTYCATNTRSLITASRKVDSDAVGFSFIVDGFTTSLVGRLSSRSGLINVRTNGKNACLKFADTEVYFRQPEGKYPNFRAIIPKDNPIKTTFDRKLFIDTISRIALLCPQSGLIKFEIKSERATISVDDIDLSRKSKETVECTSTGDITIGLKSDLIIQALKSFSEGTLTISMTDGSHAALVTGSDDDFTTVLVMPMMI
jgi:DNA polymerase-3 subunit beta